MFGHVECTFDVEWIRRCTATKVYGLRLAIQVRLSFRIEILELF